MSNVAHTVTRFLRRPQYFVSDDEDDEKRVVRSQKDKRSAVHIRGKQLWPYEEEC